MLEKSNHDTLQNIIHARNFLLNNVYKGTEQSQKSTAPQGKGYHLVRRLGKGFLKYWDIRANVVSCFIVQSQSVFLDTWEGHWLLL